MQTFGGQTKCIMGDVEMVNTSFFFCQTLRDLSRYYRDDGSANGSRQRFKYRICKRLYDPFSAIVNNFPTRKYKGFTDAMKVMRL